MYKFIKAVERSYAEKDRSLKFFRFGNGILLAYMINCVIDDVTELVRLIRNIPHQGDPAHSIVPPIAILIMVFSYGMAFWLQRTKKN